MDVCLIFLLTILVSTKSYIYTKKVTINIYICNIVTWVDWISLQDKLTIALSTIQTKLIKMQSQILCNINKCHIIKYLLP